MLILKVLILLKSLINIRLMLLGICLGLLLVELLSWLLIIALGLFFLINIRDNIKNRRFFGLILEYFFPLSLTKQLQMWPIDLESRDSKLLEVKVSRVQLEPTAGEDKGEALVNQPSGHTVQQLCNQLLQFNR